MKLKLHKRILWSIVPLILAAAVLCALFALWLSRAEYGFARETSAAEQALRLSIVSAAESWLGAKESDDTHVPIIDLYNAHEPLAQGYAVQYTDDWCATFGSCAAIRSNLTSIIPTECSCERQITLWQELGCWEEDDNYLPLPGDYIYYDWDVSTLGDSTGWSDHVGIVVGTIGPFLKVIEGNKDDTVGYRIIIRNDPRIRGYGLPDFESIA